MQIIHIWHISLILLAGCLSSSLKVVKVDNKHEFLWDIIKQHGIICKNKKIYLTLFLLSVVKKPIQHMAITDVKAHLRNNVDGTHQQLVQVSVDHEVREVHQRVFEARPDLQPQLLRNVQWGA